MVVDLINSTSSEWKRDIITSTFADVDVARILRISLVANPQKDVVVTCPSSLLGFSTTAQYFNAYHSIVPEMRKGQAFKMGLELGVTEAIIEDDSLTIIKKCNNLSQDKSEIRAHIHNIQYHSSRFLSIQFKHANREANQLTHRLTVERLRNGEEFYLEGAVPGFARRTMEDEWICEPD
ncbi:hypothetical protein CXB51_017094 [Gossypium anomalum]|uniref:RNase H type-1 domain-containing protein n=1 Tax=Gossypium anomalum TaxID=47600 RepID=A0A8J5YU78_9ROSI|nr:hypothetical protein CXB51_017094 [Gossypium anomalum]